MHLKHYYGHYISRGVRSKKNATIPSFFFLRKKERSHYSSKKDEEDGIHYTFVDDIGCCSKLDVVVLAGFTTGSCMQ